MALPSRQTAPTAAPRPSAVSPPRKVAGAENVLDRIEDLDAGFDQQGYNFMLYGDSGTGKTTLWSSFPKPILVMICSGGQKPGELLSINTPEMRKVIKKVTLRNPSEMDQVVKAISLGALKHPDSGKPYATVVLDHVTGFQDLKLAAFKGWKNADGDLVTKQQKAFGDASKKDWGEIVGQIKEHLVGLLTLNQNVVIIAQERIFLPGKDEESDARAVRQGIELADVVKPKVGAAAAPSLTGWLNPACDYVVQTFIRGRVIEEERVSKIGKTETKERVMTKTDGIQFCARTGKHEIFMTKFRTTAALTGITNALPESIVLGDTIDGVRKDISGYQQLIRLIEGSKT